MISVGKVTRDNSDYYLQQVAGSAEEYYSGRGEAEGLWMGGAAHELGLSGKVSVEAFNAALNGRKVNESEPLGDKFDRRRVLAFDMTCSAPKSVSLMFGMGDEKVRQAVQEAHDAAVISAVAYIEEHAAWGREGPEGKRKVKGTGLIASAWRHRTSREADPQLHTHVVAANMVHTENGRWVALDSRRIYHQARSGGFIYQAELRKQLTESLGVEWGPVTNGLADVVGIDRDVIEVFSKRREQIIEAMDISGHRTAYSANLQALLTRKAKGKADPESIYEAWAAEGAEHGVTPETVRELCNHASVDELTVGRERFIAKQLSDASGITRERAHFDRRHVIEHVAQTAPATVGPDTIVKLADRWIEKRTMLVSEKSEAPVQAADKTNRAGERVLTTPEMVALERNLIAQSVGRMDTGIGLVPDVVKEHGLKEYGPTLEDEQRALVEKVVTSGNGVDVVIGVAGAGKTFTLDVVSNIYDDAGYRVIGAALAARAARELEDDAGIASGTLAGLLTDIGIHGTATLRERLLGKRKAAVLIIDEAAMVGTRDLAQVLDAAAEAGVKVILVGDDRQLPAIEAGGAFRGLVDRIGASVLTENRRQRTDEDKALTLAYREGRSREALSMAKEFERLVVSETAVDTRAKLIRSWWEDPDRDHSLIIAARRSDVRDLNYMAQEKRRDAGLISGEPLELQDASYHVGDRVLCRARNKHANVINGDYGEVTSIDHERREMTVRLDSGEEAMLGAWYVADPERVQLGYAITAHIAQGATAESAHVLGSELLFQELAYTALSRGRAKNVLYVTAAPIEPMEAGFDPQKDYDPLEEIERALNRSEAQALAIDVGEPDRYAAWSDADLLAALSAQRARMSAELAQLGSGESEMRRKARERIGGRDALVEEWAQSHPGEVHEFVSLKHEMEQRVRVRTRLLELSPPDYLTQEIGDRPDSPLARSYWIQGVRAIELYRLRWGISDSESAAGPPSANVDEQRERAALDDLLTRTRGALEAAPERIVARSL